MRFSALSRLVWTAVLLGQTSPHLQAQAPIQEWIDQAIQAGGGVVTIPPGEHELTRGLLVRGAKKLALRGMERERCVLRLADSADATALITIGEKVETVEIANLVLESSATAATHKDPPRLAIRCGPGTAIASSGESSGPRDVTVRDCFFQNWPGTAIHFTDTRDAAVERCSFREITGTAVLMDRQSIAVDVLGCWFIRCGLALDVTDSARGRFRGNEILQGKEGIRIRGTATVKNPNQPIGHELSYNHLAQLEGMALQIAATAERVKLFDNEIEGKTDLQSKDNAKPTGPKAAQKAKTAEASSPLAPASKTR